MLSFQLIHGQIWRPKLFGVGDIRSIGEGALVFAREPPSIPATHQDSVIRAEDSATARINKHTKVERHDGSVNQGRRGAA